KRAVANRWPRNRGKPAVENGIFRGEPCQHGELVRWEIGHNGPRGVGAGALRGIALDEALHVRGPACARRRTSEDLQVHTGEVMTLDTQSVSKVQGITGLDIAAPFIT